METFEGDKKSGKWFFSKYEKEFVDYIVPKIPSFIQTYQLTLLTIIWSLLIILFSFFARNNISWLWLVSLCIGLQYLSDLLDGAVGRYRKTGLIKWGYYMDHFLDFVFLCSIILGYAIVLQSAFWYVFMFLLAITGALMVHSFLFFSVTNKFKISYFNFGPTEARGVFIVFNIFIIFFGKSLLELIMVGACILLFIILIVVVYRDQKEIWELDMKSKHHRLN